MYIQYKRIFHDFPVFVENATFALSLSPLCQGVAEANPYLRIPSSSFCGKLPETALAAAMLMNHPHRLMPGLSTLGIPPLPQTG